MLTGSSLLRRVGSLAIVGLFGLPLLAAPVGAQEPLGLAADTSATWTFVPAERVASVRFGYAFSNVAIGVSFPGFFETLPADAVEVTATAGSRSLSVVPFGEEEDGFQIWFIEFPAPLAPGQGLSVNLDWELVESDGGPILGTAAISAEVYAPGAASGTPTPAAVVVPEGFVAYGATAELSTDEAVAPYEPVRVQFTDPAVFVERVADTTPVITVADWDDEGVWADLVVDRAEAVVSSLDTWFGGRGEPLVVRRGLAGGGHPSLSLGENPAVVEVVGTEASEIDHQLAHAWLEGLPVEGDWLEEGLARSFSGTSPEVIPGAEVVPPVAEEIGAAGLRAVVDALRSAAISYPGEGNERQPIDPDWRTVLDVMENRGGSELASDQFRAALEGVAPGEADAAAALDRRAAARLDYFALADRAGAWSLPPLLRTPMAAWDFEEFQARQAEVSDVILRRDSVAAWAEDLGLAPRDDARAPFEQASENMDEVVELIHEQEEALEAFAEAERLVDDDRGLLARVGLIGEDPDSELERLRLAWSEGDDAEVARAGDALAHQAEGAVGRGTVRLLVPALLLVALIQAVRWLRRRAG